MIRFTEKAARAPATRTPASSHKFAIGASVSYRIIGQAEPAVFKVTKQLPEQSGRFQYRIKSDTDGKERVAPESDLVAIS